MNPSLQTLLRLIQENSALSKADQEAMNRAVKELGKALNIAEFKLNRTEKEKRTVSVLLEETIDELQRKSLVLEQANINLTQAINTVKATQEQLIHKEKLASLGELMAGIAHEIQNPLNFVNNFSEVSAELVTEIEEELQKPDRDTELEAELLNDLMKNLQKITHHGGRASAIVRGMLEHSRSGTGEKQLTNLTALADEYLRLAYQGLRAKDKAFTCDLVTGFTPALRLVDLVPQEIGRVLLNLYNNAFYAVQERAKQAISDYQPAVWVSTRQEPGRVVVCVRDNGLGIPETIQAKIFQPFFTTKPTGEGTGLGLSLSYDIVTKGHSGTLDVRSEPGQFSEFIITLPNPQLPA